MKISTAAGPKPVPDPSSHAAQWDLICVGAGITSLAFAAQLAMRHPGLRVLIVEKHIVPGGYASVFHRPKQDAIFDCSLHKLSGMTGSGNLRRIFQSLGLMDELELVYPDDYFQASLPGKTVLLPNNAAQLKKLLCELYPEDSEALEQFFADVELHGKNSYFQFQMMNGSYDVPIGELIRHLRFAHKNFKGITVDEAFHKMFKSSEVRELLAMPGCYVGGHPEDLSYLYFLHIIYATLYCGNAYVRGASQKLSDALVKRIEQAGGKVLLQTQVERIEVDNDMHVKGVTTEHGFYSARQIYVNAAPRYAVEELLDPELPLQATKEKLSELRPSWATTTLYLVTDIDPAECGLDCIETFLVAQLNDDAKHIRDQAAKSADPALCELAYWKLSPIEVTNYHALEPNNGRVLIFNLLDAVNHWPQRRTPEYKQKKQRATEAMLERLYERFPGFRGHVQYTEVSSPHTYRRYTNNTDGAGFGAFVGTAISPHVFHHNFPISGLYFMSTWVAGASYEAAFGYAEHKALGWTPEEPASTVPLNQLHAQQKPIAVEIG
jgi:all-trans-retinol 13,14-reductase